MKNTTRKKHGCNKKTDHVWESTEQLRLSHGNHLFELWAKGCESKGLPERQRLTQVSSHHTAFSQKKGNEIIPAAIEAAPVTVAQQPMWGKLADPDQILHFRTPGVMVKIPFNEAID